MQFLFECKVALVTGAASSVGQAVAFFNPAKWGLRNFSDIEDNETVDKIKHNGGKAVYIKSNVSKANEYKKLTEKITSIYGTI